MAENSGISWTDSTFNPWMGCTKVSPACQHCYAERDMDHRHKKVNWGPNGTRVLTGDAYWKKPIKWNKTAIAVCERCWHESHCEESVKGNPFELGYDFECSSCEYPVYKLRRQRVFCASLADVFEDWQGLVENSQGVQIWKTDTDVWTTSDHYKDTVALTMSDVRQRLFDLIDATPNLDWLLLTKRPENILNMWPDKKGDYIPEAGMMNQPSHRHNCWLGCSVENQEYAEKRIPELLKCRDLAPVLFLSCEPLLGPVNLTDVVAQKSFYGDMDLHPNDRLDALRGEVISGMSSCQVYDSFPTVDWVISGGESGPDARPSHPEWFESLRDQCSKAGVAFHHKQNGAWSASGEHMAQQEIDMTTGSIVLKPNQVLMKSGLRVGKILMTNVGVKASGRLLDGVLHNEFPKVQA